jgi:hypothetical protein
VVLSGGEFWGLRLGKGSGGGAAFFFFSAWAVAHHGAEGLICMANPSNTKLERMLPICEVADLLSVHKRTIQREIQRGNLLPVVDVSGETRIPLSTIRRYISDRTVRRLA